MKCGGRNSFACLVSASFLIGFFLFLAACTAPSAPKAPPPPLGKETRGPGEAPVSQHAWKLLLTMDSEDKGYGMYTYVLFGRRSDLPGGVEEETLARYKNLLNALVASTLSAEQMGELSKKEKEETNIFCIPAIAAGKNPSLANYNSVLSLRYLTMLSRMVKGNNPKLADRLAVRPGPFLISTLQPIGEIQNQGTPLLYADLSTTNPAAMAEVVTAYKRRLGRKSVNEVERFSPLRMNLLNLVLNADENVRVVKVALKEWIPK